jgi:hypothetical protein
MTTKAGSKSEIDILVREARKNGFKTVPAPGGHKKFVDHHGKPVTDSKGPVIISSSPGDFRWREMTVKRMMGAGILKTDPFESSPKGKAVQRLKGGAVSGKGGGSRLADPDVQQKKVEAIHAKAAAERAETQGLREKWEPIIVKLGGWKMGMVTQVADVAFWWNEHRGHVDRFTKQSSARSAIQSMKLGQTLNERNRKAFEFFVDELLKAKDPRERYFEILRLSKGLPAKEEDETIRGGTPLPDPQPKEAAQKPTNGSGAKHRIGPATKPSLALEAVAQMMVGRTEVDEKVLAIGQQIQDMELAERGYE